MNQLTKENQSAGWLRVVDEAMVSSHLGIADSSDSYEVAKKKLNDLICWNIAVVTDPAVNGGWKLVPIEPTATMLHFGACSGISGVRPTQTQTKMAKQAYAAMITAAPEVGK